MFCIAARKIPEYFLDAAIDEFLRFSRGVRTIQWCYSPAPPNQIVVPGVHQIYDQRAFPVGIDISTHTHPIWPVEVSVWLCRDDGLLIHNDVVVDEKVWLSFRVTVTTTSQLVYDGSFDPFVIQLIVMQWVFVYLNIRFLCPVKRCQ